MIMKKSHAKRARGFTLIELMVMLAVLAIVITAGLPQMMVFFKGNRMVTNTNELVSGLQIARSQAIKEGSRVTICKSTNAGAATPSCAAGAEGWEDGWFVFVESPGGTVGEYVDGTDGPILKINTGAEGTNVTITANNTQIDKFVSFTSRGTPKQGNGVSQSGLFKVCDDRGLKNASGTVVARGVDVSASGRVRSTNDETKIGACP